MLKRISVVLLALMLSVALRASAQALGLGDVAPKLDVKEFVKGKPVKEFQRGKIYVVEFWATWCGPCKVSIPHLTEMAHKNKDVTFIGVSVLENDPSQVKPFVTSMGNRMDYAVATDNVPTGGNSHGGPMAKNWLAASHQDGIPTAFLIDKDSRIAWIGHPMEMEKPLARIVAGKWSVKIAKDEAARAVAEQSKLMALDARLQSTGGDPQKVVVILNEAIQKDPMLEPRLASVKLRFLLSDPKSGDKPVVYGNHLVETVYKDDSEQLKSMAWSLVDPNVPKRPVPLLKLALKAAIQADVLEKGKDVPAAAILAKTYFDNGNTAKAIETQSRALTLAKGTKIEKDLAQHLAEYKKAAKH